jgi:CheY-like chemotaxis protein/HPt (histidine-containing phosphotransfer) domain-containing protein
MGQLEDAEVFVDLAENGEVALRMVRNNDYDIVLMDMQMPVMDGQTATRRLRAQGCTLPIIALTANAMKGFEHELEDAGFSGFQTKPIDVDALLQDLAQRLGAQAIAASQTQLGSAPAAGARGAHSAVDTGPIVSRLAGHAKLGRIVDRFVAQLPDKLAQMKDVAQRGDYAELAALAHWLKGAGGSMGYDDLYEPAKVLEDAARGRDPAAVSAVITRLQDLAGRITRGSASSPLAPAETVA